MLRHTRLQILLVPGMTFLAALIIFGGCGAGGGGGGGGGGGSIGAADYFTIGQSTLTEASADNEVGFDPYVVGFHLPARLPPWTDLGAASFGTGSEPSWIVVALGLNTPAGGPSAVGNYSLDAGDVPGSGLLSYDTDAFFCGSMGGSATVTSDGGVGGSVTGNFTVTDWIPISGTCPSAVSGSFSVTREPDDKMGNDGTQFDTFTIGLQSFTENATTLYDPLAYTVLYPDYAGAASGDLYFYLNAGGSLSTGNYSDYVHIVIHNASTTFPTGTWNNASSDVSMYVRVGSTSCLVSNTASNTATFTSTGAIGAKIEGSYDFQAITGTGCPASLSGSFSVTREADD